MAIAWACLGLFRQDCSPSVTAQIGGFGRRCQNLEAKAGGYRGPGSAHLLAAELRSGSRQITT